MQKTLCKRRCIRPTINFINCRTAESSKAGCLQFCATTSKWQRKKAPVQTDAFEDGIDYISQLESASLQQDVAAAYESKVEAETVQSILNKLPEKYKAVLILYYMDDSSYQEIAEMLAVPVGTVMSRLSRAKQMMKKSLLRSTISHHQTNKVIKLNVSR